MMGKTGENVKLDIYLVLRYLCLCYFIIIIENFTDFRNCQDGDNQELIITVYVPCMCSMYDIMMICKCSAWNW